MPQGVPPRRFFCTRSRLRVSGATAGEGKRSWPIQFTDHSYPGEALCNAAMTSPDDPCKSSCLCWFLSRRRSSSVSLPRQRQRCLSMEPLRSSADQLTLDFVLPDFSPFADANMKFRTYQYSGGSASPSPGNIISPGGMDSVIDLYGPSGHIAGSDDITGSLDSELRTSGFAGAAGATVISPLLGGDHDLVLRNFGSLSLGNGSFALNALSTAGAFFVDQGFTVNGLTGTAGVSINRVTFGATC